MDTATGDWEEDGAARWTPGTEAEPDYREMAARETVAMSEIDTALEPLDDAARSRVLRWALERFGVSTEELGRDE